MKTIEEKAREYGRMVIGYKDEVEMNRDSGMTYAEVSDLIEDAYIAGSRHTDVKKTISLQVFEKTIMYDLIDDDDREEMVGELLSEINQD